MFERALEIAREAHAGQVDKAGRPVIEHVLRVVDAVEGEDAKVVAALHDVLEDSRKWQALGLIAAGIRQSLVIDVWALTRFDHATYAAYIDRIATRRRARTVKIADLRDHIHPDRVGALTLSHAERYRRALRQLGVNEGGSDAG